MTIKKTLISLVLLSIFIVFSNASAKVRFPDSDDGLKAAKEMYKQEREKLATESRVLEKWTDRWISKERIASDKEKDYIIDKVELSQERLDKISARINIFYKEIERLRRALAEDKRVATEARSKKVATETLKQVGQGS